ncbi:MAG: alpha/beta hydrolase [Bacteroidetes bacterium]|nr:alpha/beta hydrolase [Bacteroidota bacterium]
MKKLSFLFIFACHYFFGQITGEWHAAFSVARQNTRMDLFIDRVGRDGTLKIGLPDVSGFEPKIIENSTISKDSLSFTWENIALSFSGKYQTNGDSLFGTMKQSGLEWKVTFKREIQVAKKVNRPQVPKPKFAYDIQEIEIKNEKNVIGATLTLPKGKSKFPIVILSSGSGPQNRDCEIMGHKPFWVIADYLSNNGIGVLRFDDRGVGKSTGEFSKASLFDFASDVEACYKYVKKNFKGHKIGLAGHSEGGMHTLIVAAKNPKLDFLIQLASVGTNGRDVLVEQQYLIPKSSGKSESYAKANSMVYDSVTSILIINDNKSFPTEVNNFLKRNFDQFPEDYKKEGTMEEFAASLTNFLNNEWGRQFMQFNTGDYLSKIHCPILVINGSEDIQVPPTKNQEGFRNGFSIQSNSLNKSKIILVPGLNHLMQSCKSCTIMEYGEIEETFSPIVLKSIADWINNHMLFEKH